MLPVHTSFFFFYPCRKCRMVTYAHPYPCSSGTLGWKPIIWSALKMGSEGPLSTPICFPASLLFAYRAGKIGNGASPSHLGS